MMNYVITGTREVFIGSKFRIASILEQYKDTAEAMTFGGAIGTDTLAAHEVASWADRPFMRLVLPADRSQVDNANKFIEWDEVVEMSDGSTYMDRNDRMLDSGDYVIGFPRGGRERTRSGTWATIRRGEKRGYTVDIHPLDGSPTLWRLK